jgi:uncharacterized protein YegL
MPRFDAVDENTEEFKIPGTGNFKFSGTRIDSLGESGADEYTLITIALDCSGSVQYYKDQLEEMVKTIIRTCRSHATAEKIMVRVITFDNELIEVHGFKELMDIDENVYSFTPRGMTALFDAVYSSIGATITYGESLISQNFDANADVYIITDGMDNVSTMTPRQIKGLIDDAIQKEEIESIRTFLIGLDSSSGSSGWDDEVKQHLKKFKDEANITEFISVGDANSKNLAKLANYVSQSISAQSQSLGSGGPSQVLTF